MSTSDHPEPLESTSPASDAPDGEQHRQEAVDRLLLCLQSELVALHGYDLALRQATNPDVSQRLLELHGDHARRADLLQSRIKGREATSEAATAAGSALAGFVPPDSVPPDSGGSIAALEAFEHRGLELYRDGIALVDPSTREFFRTVLLPAQQRTHDLCRSLKGYIRQPAP